MELISTELKNLGHALRGVQLGANELVRQMKQARRTAQPVKAKQPGSSCSSGECATPAQSMGSTGLKAATSAMGSLRRSFNTTLGSDLRRMLRSVLSSFTRQIALSIGRSVGGGFGGGLLSTLIGGGLSLALGRLFGKRRSVRVENTVRTEVLNFPRLAGLDYAANPASRLFGSRAVARGPAFSVEVNYRDGAEDVVVAKVASKLMDINSMTGVV